MVLTMSTIAESSSLGISAWSSCISGISEEYTTLAPIAPSCMLSALIT